MEGGGTDPLGGQFRSRPWGAAPRCPACPAGVPISPEKWGERGPGLCPWTPVFMARLLPLARFGVCATLSRWRGYHGTHVCALIWRLSFIKCFFSIFFPENAFQIGLRIPEEIAPRTDPGQQPPKRASGNERAIKKGGRGATPRDSLRPGFLRRKPGSRPESGGKPPRRSGPALVQNRTTCRGPSPATLCVRAFSRESLDPRPGPGGNPRGRSGPALVLTEPP